MQNEEHPSLIAVIDVERPAKEQLEDVEKTERDGTKTREFGPGWKLAEYQALSNCASCTRGGAEIATFCFLIFYLTE